MSNIKKSIISIILIALVLMSFTSCSFLKHISVKEENTEVTEEGTESKEEEKAIEEKLSYDPDRVYSYTELKDMLTAKLEKAGYGEKVDELFYSVFDALYTNYPTWQVNYRDMPDVDKYIIEKLIDPIDRLAYVKFYTDYDEACEAENDNNLPSGWTEPAEEYGFWGIGIIADGYNDEECFFHEIIHVYSNDIIFPFDYDDAFYNFYRSISEGVTTFHQRFVNEYTTDIGGSWCYENEEYSIQYNKENCVGYLICLNDYEKMRYLAGYDNLRRLEKGLITKDEFIRAIAQHYGNEEEINEFFLLMGERMEKGEENWKAEGVFEMAVELENRFLALMKQDIENAGDPQEREMYIKEYQYYREKNMPTITVIDGYDDISSEFFNIFEVD